jgi:hypothetical protein
VHLRRADPAEHEHPGYLPKLQQAVAEGKAKIKPKGEF